jgi:hypothetical protein
VRTGREFAAVSQSTAVAKLKGRNIDVLPVYLQGSATSGGGKFSNLIVTIDERVNGTKSVLRHLIRCSYLGTAVNDRKD